MGPLGYRRSTPNANSTDSGMHRAVPDGRSSRAVLRALALLIDRVVTVQALRPPEKTGEIDAELVMQPLVRDALRQLTARSRDGALLCRIVDGQLVLEGVPIERRLAADDPLLGGLLRRSLTLGIGSITVRQGAAPGELLTLASLFAQPFRTGEEARPLSGDTPTTITRAVMSDEPPRELLRSWSVLVTPLQQGADPMPRFTPSSSAVIDDSGIGTSTAGGSAVANALTRLAAARTDEAALAAGDLLVELIDGAEFRGDALTIESIARATMQHVHTVGGSGGRLGGERIMRRLLHRASLKLLATRVPYTPERTITLELMARAGDAAVEVLVQELMSSQESQARRAYFDSIVALDLNATLLFDLVRDNRWFVVRNAVALLGEMGVEQADVAMLPLLTHDDDRIRIAAARALMRLGTAKAMHGLHGVIEDQHPEVRRIAAAAYGLPGLGGGGVRPPAARLAAALDKERDEDVALEMLASLGKLGSADAIQRLLRIAQPAAAAEPGERQINRDAWIRIAALEALVRARGYAVMGAIDSLAGDADPEVAAAVVRLRATIA
ncbi:HEAT repeat domain-containing protein [Gemmatimonas groenlandica]|uniref:HEAT repeat domain-containing protein n=1 Tax=Gemmatimonas groenlandica TaxID=2732249 RepID=A0A6M4IRW2_9BACT|nr:HEAT repeat domain-containing protein [Gemmatimonas groenlandica]QJR36247.1 HEAT repeat domain-containing protein [Gemmatimonas groenlandica]